MSRVKRQKERKLKKQRRMKTAMTSLALTLTIGSMQSMGTYAWFVDSENVDNDLVLEMGNLDVEIGSGFKIDQLEKGKPYSEEFDIENKGTLNQKIYLYFKDTGTSFSEDLLENITYKLDINYEGTTIYTLNLSGDKLNESLGNIEVKDGINDFILSPNKKLNCKASITLNDTYNSKDQENQYLNFDLNVRANQANLKNGGFFDVSYQANQINYKNIESETSLEICPNCNNNTIKVKVPLKGGEKINCTRPLINVVGDEKKEDYYLDSQSSSPYIYICGTQETGLTLEKVKTETFIIDLNIETENTHYNRYKFRITENNGVLGAEFEFLGVVDANGDYVSSTITEEKVADKLEVVEPPKEDVVLPSEPEIVEPPKEDAEVPVQPEVVEPPKPEIEQPQIQPEIIEPPVDNKEIQE